MLPKINVDAFYINGVLKVPDLIPKEIVADASAYVSSSVVATRGHTADGSYVSNPVGDEVWANTWTNSVTNHPFVTSINNYISDIIRQLGSNAKLLHSDFAITYPGFAKLRPHIDTPHRFPKWADVRELIGIQVAVPLSALSKKQGITGFVLGSHKISFDIAACYRGEHNDFFNVNASVFDVAPGDVLIWDSRILHSAMPNNTQVARPLLLLSYVDASIYDEVLLATQAAIRS